MTESTDKTKQKSRVHDLNEKQRNLTLADTLQSKMSKLGNSKQKEQKRPKNEDVMSKNPARSYSHSMQVGEDLLDQPQCILSW